MTPSLFSEETPQLVSSPAAHKLALLLSLPPPFIPVWPSFLALARGGILLPLFSILTLETGRKKVEPGRPDWNVKEEEDGRQIGKSRHTVRSFFRSGCFSRPHLSQWVGAQHAHTHARLSALLDQNEIARYNRRKNEGEREIIW